MLVKVFSRLPDRIECDPIAPYGNFALSARKLDRRIAVVLVTFIILRANIVLRHLLIPHWWFVCFFGLKSILS
jgi:hypothetical protein